MLKVNVGLSRKLSRDYNSTGFSLNLEGEICVGTDDPDTLIEKIREFYDLAEEALSQQIERYEGESAIASRDEDRPSRDSSKGRHLSGANSESKPSVYSGNGNGQRGQSSEEAATNKQIQYLLNLGKRHGLTPQQLEGRLLEIIGRSTTVYELTKREAGQMIESLAENTNSNSGRGRQRNSRN